MLIIINNYSTSIKINIIHKTLLCKTTIKNIATLSKNRILKQILTFRLLVFTVSVFCLFILRKLK